MPNFKLKFKENIMQEYPVGVGQTITIGRKDSNHIVIDNLAVSGIHARVDSVSATFILTDLESTNGTFVNGELVSSHTLRNGDVIMIGKHELVYDSSDIGKKPQIPGEEDLDDKTRFLDTAEYRELINKASGNTEIVQASKPSAPQEGKKATFFLSRLWMKFFG